MTLVSSSTARLRQGWPGSTRGPWARPPTSRSRCRCTRALFLPESWDDQKQTSQQEAQQVRQRRARARIPDTQRHEAKWEQALEMLDELATWGHRPPMVVADAGYGESSPFRTGLSLDP